MKLTRFLDIVYEINTVIAMFICAIVFADFFGFITIPNKFRLYIFLIMLFYLIEAFLWKIRQNQQRGKK